MKKKLLLLMLFSICFGAFVQAQNQIGIVKGKVVNRKGRAPISNAKVSIGEPPRTVQTKDDGSFEIDGVLYGTHKLSIQAQDFQPTEYNVKVDYPEVNVNFISMSEVIKTTSDIDDAAFAEYDTENINEEQAMPAMLSSSQDVFNQIASYNFSTMRFRERGYDNSSQDIYMNGVYMNDAMTGNGNWSLWGGLNDATRNQENASRLNAFEYGVGGANGTTNILARASQMRKGFRASAVTANGQYRARFMASYASGNLDNGWSYALSVSTRQGDNDYVKGVRYNSWAYFASIEKLFGTRHRLALTFFGSPTQRGAQIATTDEVYNLVGDNYYNANWGYQNGKIRNTRVRNYHEPVAILNYFFDIDDRTKLNLNASYRFGKNGYSSLDWYDAQDPKPDYYKNLPSYYIFKGEPNKAELIADDWRNNTNGLRQYNWDRLYNINYNSTDDWGEYEGVKMGSGRSKYIVSERHTDQRDFNFNVKLSRTIDQYTKLHAGADLRVNRTEYYTKVKDLLGGQYWLNIDNFAERDFKNVAFETLMNDVGNTKNLVVGKGDKYGYDYYANVRNIKLWSVLNINKGRWEGFAAGEIGYSQIWRDGIYREGLFPNDSKGNSTKKKFFTYTGKGGITYKLTGNQNITLSGVAMAKAPNFTDMFVSPRTRNELVKNLKPEKTVGGDLTYAANFPFLKMRLSGYYTLIQDQTKLLSYWDYNYNAYTNFAMTGIDQQFLGLEFGAEVPIFSWLSAEGGLSWGDYKYTSNPVFTQTRDNSSAVIAQDEKVYWKNFKVEGTPQLAASLGLNFKTNDYLFFGVDAGYYQDMYLSMTPAFRTLKYLDGRYSKEQIHEMVHEERLSSAFLLNANIGKSWYIKRKYNIGFSLQVKNILNRQNIKTGGYEQTRVFTNDDSSVATNSRYGSCYFYLYGISYYLNVYFRF